MAERSGDRYSNPPAVPNVCVFRSVPVKSLPFPLRLLERHRYSTQMFVPMTNPPATATTSRHSSASPSCSSSSSTSTSPTAPSTSAKNAYHYLVVVALSDPRTGKPDLATLKAFRASSTQAFAYAVGTWHHPMISLDASVTDFVCIVYERGPFREGDEDCEEVFYCGKEAGVEEEEPAAWVYVGEEGDTGDGDREGDGDYTGEGGGGGGGGDEEEDGDENEGGAKKKRRV
ncbi:ureidoglycolate hydrolase-domain-containing protein [Zopfochytrium polystomum]|nr:ureidoglycolate hydrolase-domain-containing protein [Zopfochytrium polystomum]